MPLYYACDTAKIAEVENAGVEKVGVSGMESQTLNKQGSCTHFKHDTTVRSVRSSASMLHVSSCS